MNERVKKLTEAVTGKLPKKKMDQNLCPECGLTYEQCNCDEEEESKEYADDNKGKQKKKGLFVSTQPILHLVISTPGKPGKKGK